MKPYIYLRAIRLVEHSVFCVSDGQKTYWDRSTGAPVEIPFSSGQQVKRSILQAMLENLNELEAPVDFNFALKGKKVGNAEPHSPCDPTYADQLLGGWMRAKAGETTIKRRSPLSISAMRPLHPLLATTSTEDVTFDRSQNPARHNIMIRDADGKPITLEQAIQAVGDNMRDLTPRIWIGDALKTASGIFVYDICIDLRRLFSVSLQKLEPELHQVTIDKLRAGGWLENSNVFGPCLTAPKERRDQIISALAEALIDWRITSNQSRTFSLMAVGAVAVGEKANAVAAAIRASLRDDTDKPTAYPVVDRNAGAHLFIDPTAKAYIPDEVGSSNALDNARQWLIDRMMAYPYEG